MSIKKAENTLDDFLKDENNGVLVLKGDWGIGKTFFLKKFLEERKGSPEYSFTRYSYNSLFGISTVEELKTSIIENTITKKQIGNVQLNNIESSKNRIGWFKNKVSRWRKWREKIAKGFSQSSSFHKVLHSLGFFDPKKTLVCVDDFERSTLNTSEVLGIINYLKEERGCKVILIFNENELKDQKKEYKTYKEKVVDIELEFSPALEECINLIFTNHGNQEIQKILYESCYSLGIKNIRILRKIKNLSVPLIDILEGLDMSIIKQGLQTLCLFSLCNYSDSSNKIPTISFLTDKMSMVEALMVRLDSSARAQPTDEEKEWTRILHNYGYFGTDNMDLLIYEGIKQGYFDKDKIIEEGLQKQKINELNEGKNAPSKILREHFYGCFDNNEAKFTKLLVESAKRNIEYIDFGELNQIVSVLRDINYSNNKITNLINFYIHKNKKKVMKFNTDRVRDYLTDTEIKNKFAIQIQRNKKVKTLEEAINTISEGSWSPEDEERLLKAKQKELYMLYKKGRGIQLENIIRVTTMYFNRATPKPEEITFNNLVKKVLTKIQKESLMNKIRLKNLGINLT